jgi:hypothetical protein
LTFTACGYSNNQREATLLQNLKVLKEKTKIDEKRAITPRWVMRFTSTLQGMQILTY